LKHIAILGFDRLDRHQHALDCRELSGTLFAWPRSTAGRNVRPGLRAMRALAARLWHPMADAGKLAQQLAVRLRSSGITGIEVVSGSEGSVRAATLPEG